jgi:hypothetical protein
LLAKLTTLKGTGGVVLEGLELTILCALYREHFLFMRCVCCGVGDADSAQSVREKNESRLKGFAKIWNATSKRERCWLNTANVEEIAALTEDKTVGPAIPRCCIIK